jgi:hypothetical protein
MSVFVMAAAMSLRCSVRRLFSSACIHERSVSSKMNISQACKRDELNAGKCHPHATVYTFANNTGASALIMRTSSSDFIICTRTVPCLGARAADEAAGKPQHLLDPGQWQLVVFELGWVVANALDFNLLTFPEGPQLFCLLS